MKKAEAYKIICGYLQEEPYVTLCKENADYFGFYVAAPDTQEGQPVFVNNYMLCVNKKTGEISSEEDINTQF